jgi:hypothetical protein
MKTAFTNASWTSNFGPRLERELADKGLSSEEKTLLSNLYYMPTQSLLFNDV